MITHNKQSILKWLQFFSVPSSLYNLGPDILATHKVVIYMCTPDTYVQRHKGFGLPLRQAPMVIGIFSYFPVIVECMIRCVIGTASCQSAGFSC